MAARSCGGEESLVYLKLQKPQIESRLCWIRVCHQYQQLRGSPRYPRRVLALVLTQEYHLKMRHPQQLHFQRFHPKY